MDGDITLDIAQEGDLLEARSRARELAGELGFEGVSLTLIATAVSELARNILNYAGKGQIQLTARVRGAECGLSVVARDEGPGIVDVDLAMQDGFSTGGGLGLGLPGTRRLMDEFELVSTSGGTTVTTTKWLERRT